MYELILLDADHTIFDYDRAEEFALFEVLKQFNVKGDYNHIRSLYRPINSNLWKMLERGEIKKEVIRTRRFEELLKTIGAELPAEEFGNYYLKKLGEGNFLIDGAEDLCRYLSSKYRVVILTNGIKDVQNNRIRTSKVIEYIDEIITSDEVGVSKPDPKIYRWAFNKLGHSNKKTTLMVGNSLGSDIQGGINFGIDTLWYNYNNQITDKNITYTVNSLKEIYNIL